ncbi:MAG: hypothetical protein A3C93_00635 [Candidatus Lloydbacteria bacterium RIFCSPHIGHO2_02_FULL_54_17]|uniref:Uncharacterized protein n=1 Tax=Candidatus Lloydbacteria bacterium RIFCSPHIGHO2_02_FULL_54_17 TaxID=1798664 RepID=A0A1G2DH75_9BACT|nr:MAG: hypothetical protein A2762_03550 [Candidatus Lloydbacteria bacterium RIFCSPHIGHO2_01_FULL_54_11]OGZ12148.1 MAG: hypothetical protein A3C93_00635 [Candidatus Lloydbacteria bacterium RIFCSPHIGHO2_02_FULL_54_17]OGZ12938.1 MAG: hypothetical protein A2948_01075 [Candidatus Lloydbacteria bacterium RIFCSPLOWO2_01_FULL_54_18]OGZ15938.1 MAG: hypothetical protein A3H76_02440 [Candidatus Lloydbacteria bacterium RIFCSPLOWO2_02_FULL_54_12]
MPPLHFVIDSITEVDYRKLLEGYRNSFDTPPHPLSLVARVKNILWSLNFLRKKTDAPQEDLRMYRGLHPVFDTRFLEFCVIVANYMSRGYVIGPGDGKDFFYAYDEVTLWGSVRGEFENYDGWNKLVTKIAPHAYDEEIPDIPTRAHLRTLQALSRDPSLSQLLNRLALWFLYFACSVQYCREIVAFHPKTGDQQVLDTCFFKTLAPHLHF